MSKTIWKFPTPIADEFMIRMDVDSEVLCVQIQQSAPCVWAVVNPDAREFKNFRFFWMGTGHPIPDVPVKYIGTVQMDEGSLIYHLFKEVK